MAKYNIINRKKEVKNYCSGISESTADKIYIAIYQYIVVEKAYKKPNISAITTAEHLGIDKRRISMVMRRKFDTTFPLFINSLRIKDFCNSLKNQKTSHQNLELLGLKFGFSSRQALYVAFYREKGITPGQYLQNINTERQKKEEPNICNDDSKEVESK